jgi:PLAT/LH2 domain
VTTPELGPLQQLVIGHNNQGCSPAWLLDRLELVNGRSGVRYAFHVAKWLTACADGCSIVLLADSGSQGTAPLLPRPSQPPLPQLPPESEPSKPPLPQLPSQPEPLPQLPSYSEPSPLLPHLPQSESELLAQLPPPEPEPGFKVGVTPHRVQQLWTPPTVPSPAPPLQQPTPPQLVPLLPSLPPPTPGQLRAAAAAAPVVASASRKADTCLASSKAATDTYRLSPLLLTAAIAALQPCGQPGYRVTFFTSNVLAAGTASRVFFELLGELGSSGVLVWKVYLPHYVGLQTRALVTSPPHTPPCACVCMQACCTCARQGGSLCAAAAICFCSRTCHIWGSCGRCALGQSLQGALPRGMFAAWRSYMS